MHLNRFLLLTAYILAFNASLTSCSSSSSDGSKNEGNDTGDGDSAGDGDGAASGDGDGDSTTRVRGKQPGATFVHLFEWPWSDIATECELFLGPAGYAAVQVSPPNEHALIKDQPWWQRYQPVSYVIESRSGTAAEFADMVTRCGDVGVDIYVDAILNHMSSQSVGTGSNGTEFTSYEYPGTWIEEDFHLPKCNIEGSDYSSNANNVRNCELLGLHDLRTEADNVRQRLAAYLISLTEMGVRGFRIDAAKHVEPTDIKAIIELVNAASEVEPYFFLEVIDYGGEAISASEFLDIGNGSQVGITEFKYLGELGAHFRGTGISLLAPGTEESRGVLPTDRATVFTNNHDTQRGDSLSYKDGRVAQLANIYMLANPYGYPKIMSSYAFELGAGTSKGPASTTAFETLGPHNKDGVSCVVEEGHANFDADSLTNLEAGRWVCEHRDPAVAAMVQFRLATAGASVTDRWSSPNNQLAFALNNLGFIVINGNGDTLTETLQTSLPADEYCNILANDDCNSTITVDDEGFADIEISANSAAAIHVAAD